MDRIVKRLVTCLVLAAYGFLNAPANAAPQLNGFAEWRSGLRLRDDAHQRDDATLNEARLQLDSSASLKDVQFRAKADFYYDGVEGKADVDPREISASVSPLSAVD